MKTYAHRKILAVAAAVKLGLATTGGAALARSGGFGGDHIGGGFRGGPYLGDTTSTPSPIFNSLQWIHRADVTRGTGLAGKSWINIPLIGECDELSTQWCESGCFANFRHELG